MEKQKKNTREDYTIDLLHIAKILWRHVWLIVLCGLLTAAIGFSIAAFAIAPTYSSYINLYVNNGENTNPNISASDLTAAQSLVRTYGVILNSRSTLQRVIEMTDVDYTWKELSQMITYNSSNDTEIMCVTVTCGDPYEASEIANAIAAVLPVRVSEIVESASMEVVDFAVPETEKVAPSITRYTAIGFVLGVLLSATVLVVIALIDDTIYDEEYVLRTYNYPILGKIPDLLDTGNKSYGHYYRKHQRM